MVTRAASVSSAGMLSLSAGQLLKVMTGLTGSRLSRLRVAPNATEAGPRRSTSHIVPSGRPAPATALAARRALATTASWETSGSVPARSDESSVISSVVFWYGAQGLPGGSVQRALASPTEGTVIATVGGIWIHSWTAVDGVSLGKGTICACASGATGGRTHSSVGEHAEARRAVGMARAVTV